MLYWATRFGPLHDLFVAMVVISVSIAVCAIFLWAASEGEVNMWKAWPSSKNWLSICVFVSVVGWVFIPTQKDILLIAGGTGVIEAVKVVAGSTIAKNSVTVIEQWLQSQIKETK